MFFRITGVGLLGSTAFLILMQATVNAAILPPPLVITQTVTASITNLITLQFNTNPSSSNWQTIGTLTGSTNVSFTNSPVVFIRGICSNLTVSATLAWNPSIDPLVTGYKVYYGVVSQTYTNAIDVGNVTEVTISNLTEGVTYYFSVTAYIVLGIESPFSNEVSGAFQPHFLLTIGNP